MSNKIGIDVQANFDTQRVDQGAREIEQVINRVNRNPISPVSDRAIKQLDALNQKFQQLLKVDAELRRRVKATGQQGALFQDINWDLTHPDRSSRARKVESVHDYLGIPPPARHTPFPPAPHPARPGAPGGGGGAPSGPTFAGGAANVAQAGLRAAGPVGSVAANALGTGMQAGLGAGIAGLIGGVLALGISKIVGNVMEKVGQAEDNSVGYDRLKRTLGDVNVSFEALKSNIISGADNLKVTYGEFSGLASQYARTANMSGAHFGSLAGEVGLGGGLSRSFGLDPSQGVGVMAELRGMGITKDVNESRKFALLIGETIGKSNAFAKADEVFEAIGNYATNQTRAGMGGANLAGYGGMYSAMVGSGIAGLDPSGAGSMLARINASLGAGGAKGEASQFFSAMVGKRMGLDPLQLQVLREGGAFATNNGMFGKGSAYARYMGKTGPGGSSTFLQGTMDMLSQQYGGNSDDQKLMRAQAFANHAGINMNQSMAMLSLKPNQMGGLEKYAGDLTKLNASGIGNLAKVVDGTDDDRRGVADSLLRRKDLSQAEKNSIDSVMKDGTAQQQKEVLGALIATHEQERTQGSDIRDSKNSLDNIKTAIADKLVPIALEMRHGIMAIAGDGKKSSAEIMADVVRLDSKDREKAIIGRFSTEKGDLESRQDHLEAKRRSLDPTALARTYGSKPEVLAQKLAERGAVLEELNHVEKRLKDIETEKADLLKKENERRNKELAGITEGIEARWSAESGGGARSSGAGGSARVGPIDPKKRDEAMAFFMSKGWTKEQAAGIVANFGAESGMNHSIVGDNGQAYGLGQWHPDRQANFAKKYGKPIQGSSFLEQLEFANYEMTEGKEQAAGNLLRGAKSASRAGEVVSRYYERPLDANGAAFARAAAAERIAGTPMPASAGGRGEDSQKVHVTVDPLVVQHQNPRGEQIAPSQLIQTRVAPATPFGGPR